MGGYFLRFFSGIGTLLASLFGFEFLKTTSKVTTRVAIMTVIAGLFIAMLVRVSAVISSITVIVPSSVAVAFSWIIPSNFVPCVSAAISVQVIIWLWKWKKFAIEFVSKGVE